MIRLEGGDNGRYTTLAKATHLNQSAAEESNFYILIRSEMVYR